jgi:hypothetical protein
MDNDASNADSSKVYTQVAQNEVNRIVQELLQSCSTILPDNVLQASNPHLCYYHDMLCFTPWDGESNPFYSDSASTLVNACEDDESALMPEDISKRGKPVKQKSKAATKKKGKTHQMAQLDEALFASRNIQLQDQADDIFDRS